MPPTNPLRASVSPERQENVNPHATQEPPAARQIHTNLGDLIEAAIKAAYHQGATIARPSSSGEAMRAATVNSMRASDVMWTAFARVMPVEVASEPGRCRCPFPESCSDAGVRR